MKARIRALLRSLLAPAISWFRAQLDAIDRRLQAVQERQDELVELNRSVLEAHDAEIDVVGRTLAQQRLALESLERRQDAVLAELQELRRVLEQDSRPGSHATAPAD
jgi:chromosome segregation ATPase